MDRLDLLEIIDDLREENSALKQKYNQTLDELSRAQRSLKVIENGALPLSGESIAQSRLGSPIMDSSDFGVNSSNPLDDTELEDSSIDPRLVPKTYTVQSGDTLSKISKRFYGTVNRWNDIYQANRDRLSSARSLRVGQELLIP